jgi:hypothetical protein
MTKKKTSSRAVKAAKKAVPHVPKKRGTPAQLIPSALVSGGVYWHDFVDVRDGYGPHVLQNEICWTCKLFYDIIVPGASRFHVRHVMRSTCSTCPSPL